MVKTEGKATAVTVKSTEGAVQGARETFKEASETAKITQAVPEQGDKRADDESAVPGTGPSAGTAEIGEQTERASEKRTGNCRKRRCIAPQAHPNRCGCGLSGIISLL